MSVVALESRAGSGNWLSGLFGLIGRFFSGFYGRVSQSISTIGRSAHLAGEMIRYSVTDSISLRLAGGEVIDQTWRMFKVTALPAGFKVIAETHADWDQEKALKFMEDTLQRFGPGQIQAIYTHNDNMAFGALRAVQAAGRAKEGILIIGIDGENAAIRAVAKGDLTATFTYSTVAPEGVIAAHALATKNLGELDKLGKMTKKPDGSMEIEIPSKMITKENAAEYFCKGFGDDPECK